MRAGQGKKHGRFVIGDDTIDTTNAPTLTQVRARTTERTGPVRPRGPAALLQVQALQAQLEEERRQREQREAEVVRHQAAVLAQQQAVQAQVTHMFTYIQNLSVKFDENTSTAASNTP
ncbi:unnamed protein product [Urochloa humidicola]